MASDLKSRVRVLVEAKERSTGIAIGGDQASNLKHPLDLDDILYDGTDAGEANRVYSTRQTITSGAALALDLRPASSVLTGGVINLVEPVLIAVRNRSSTPGETLTIGAGSNPITTIWGASGDAAVIGPGGLFLWYSPIDGAGTTAGTADVLTITSSAAGGIVTDVLILARNA